MDVIGLTDLELAAILANPVAFTAELLEIVREEVNDRAGRELARRAGSHTDGTRS